MSVWKITQTKDPQWLAVIGPYDDDFRADMSQVRGAYRNPALGAWLAPVEQRQRVEVIIEKYSPPPRVELLAGLAGAVQLLEHAERIGVDGSDRAPDLAEALALAGLEVEQLRVIEVEGKLLVVVLADLA